MSDFLIQTKVCVLIPHYNNLVGLIKSLRSLNGRTDFCVLIVDDGSDSKEKPVLENLKTLTALDNNNLIIRYTKINKGIEFALNVGLAFIEKQIDTPYIMRLDAGDICINDRIDKETEFLDKNDEVCLVGSDVEYVDSQGNHLFNLSMPVSHEEIKRRMLISVPFIHSSVIFRTGILKEVGHYSTKYKAAEDYAFFIKIIKTGITANIPEVLTVVEWSETGISLTHRKQQLKSRIRLVLVNREWRLSFVYSIIRLAGLYILPYSLIERIKRYIYK